MIITKQALPRRTFLRGLGASVALPLLDAMVPSMTALAKTRGRTRCAASASSTCRWDATSRAGRRRAKAGWPSCRRRSSRCGPVRRSAHGHQQPGAEERLSRHACDLERVVPERREGEMDREHRLPPRHDRRSGRGAADRAPDAAARRWSCRWTCSRRSASATTATPASIRTTSRGRRRRRRCPPRRIRASSSSACSARAAARPTAAPHCGRRASLLDSVREDITRLQNKLGPEDRTRVGQYLETVREVERRIQKAEAGDRRSAVAGSRSAGWRAGGLRRSREADVRPAGAGAAGRRHQGHHLPTRARDEQPDLHRDRRARSRIIRSRITATIRRRSRGWRRSTPSTSRCSPISSRS